MNEQNETETLVESFCTLADEVQYLIDRKTILEHKLRFAAEQYQQLADKYAPMAPEISDTLAHLQVPPDQHVPPTPMSYVPLPRRGLAGCNQHQIALLIRDGRRAAQQVVSQARAAALADAHAQSQSPPNAGISTNTNIVGGGGGDGSIKGALSGTGVTTMSTIMEQDFTVEGKKGVLDCPFSTIKREQQLQRQKQQLEQENQQLHIIGGAADDADMVTAVAPGTPGAAAEAAAPGAGADNSSNHNNNNVADGPDATAHNSTDPICSAMFEDSTSQRAPSSGGAARCPIRFLDQHSPEVVANYVEKHKHELPRSHAICLRRYNKNEEQIRKIDAKYGSLVNMISGLGQFHQPMLGSAEPGAAGGDEDPEDTVDRAALHRASHERVKNWANGVSSGTGQDPNYDGDVDADDNDNDNADDADADTPGRGRHRSLGSNTGSNTRRESSGSGDAGDNTEPEREGHFDRPFKEVRLGESPSRPWGIAVPISSMPHTETQPPLSPPAAPVRMPSPMRGAKSKTPAKAPPPPTAAAAKPVRKCPFDHSKFGMGVGPPPGHAPVDIPTPGKAAHQDDDVDNMDNLDKPPSSAHPMAAAQTEQPASPIENALHEHEQQHPSVFASMPQLSQTTQIPSSAGGPQAFVPPKPQQYAQYTPYTQYAQYPQHQPQPTFLNLPPRPAAGDGKPQAGMGGTATGSAGAPPPMVFTGPVFIGYPMEQAIQFMQHFQSMNMQGQGQ